ncbi:MAG: hypothetical protein NTV98_06180, partial [Candidatus Roizmanbacteria bacterium]|nr:hypothetical protein [Candidatus Roizmanbacteria bacterium]
MHDGSEDFTSSFGFSYTDGTAVAQNGSVAIDMTPVNDAPSLSVSGAMLSEGGGYTLTISGSDADGGGDKSSGLAAVNTLTYKFTDLPDNGEVRLVNANATYSATDASTYTVVTADTVIAESALSGLKYQHNNSETSSDSFTVEVNDNTAQRNSTTSRTASITVLAVNDDPVLVKDTSLSSALTDNTGGATHNPETPAYVQTSFATYEGATKVIDNTYLLGSDPDNADNQLQFRITSNVTNGQLKLSGATLATGSAFTQADLKAGIVTYVHDGSETTTDSFAFTLSDAGGGLEPGGIFSIAITAVNDAPTIILPTDRLASEEVSLAITGISIADTDAGSGNA